MQTHVYAFLDWAVVRSLSLPELGKDGYIGRVMQSRISVNPYGVEVSEDRRRRGSFEIHWLTDCLIAIYYNLFTFKFSLVSQSHLIQAFDRRTGPFDFTWLIHSPVRLDMVCSHMQDGAAHVDRHRSTIEHRSALDCDVLWIASVFEMRSWDSKVAIHSELFALLIYALSSDFLAVPSLLAHSHWRILTNCIQLRFFDILCLSHAWFILIHVVSPRGLAKSPEERRFLQGLAAIASPARCLDLLRQHGSTIGVTKDVHLDIRWHWCTLVTMHSAETILNTNQPEGPTSNAT